MSRMILFTMLLCLAATFAQAEDKRSIRAAEISFESGESSYRRGQYDEAAKSFRIVLESIPISIDSRKHLAMRLDATIKLVEIYYGRKRNIGQGCKFIALYRSDMERVRRSGVLRGRELAGYLEVEQDYAARPCERFETLDEDMERFRRTFDVVE